MNPVRFPARRQRYREIEFCPRCGRAYSPLDFKAAECLFLCSNCAYDFYQNPLPAAVVVIPHPRRPRELLVIRRRTEPGIGLWCVPGGFIRYGESPEEAAVREAREETGVDIALDSVIRAGLVDYRYRAAHLCIVEISYVGRLCGELNGLLDSSPEADVIQYRAVDEFLSEPSLLAFPEQYDTLKSYAASL